MFHAGSVAIVTGVGPGMGRSIALGFARHEVDVVLAARRPERLESVAQEVRGAGRDPLVVPTDLADRAACEALVGETIARFGRADILVQNGHHEGDWTRVVDADPDSWRAVFDVNLLSALHLAHAVVPRMRDVAGGAIVFVNSGAALRSPPTMGAYAASKAALAALTRTLALEVAAWNIRVNGVYLGPVAGENLERAGKNAARAAAVTLDEWLGAKAAELPLGFIPTPDDCAGSVLFLASQLARPVTGQHLSVNGGQWTT